MQLFMLEKLITQRYVFHIIEPNVSPKFRKLRYRCFASSIEFQFFLGKKWSDFWSHNSSRRSAMLRCSMEWIIPSIPSATLELIWIVRIQITSWLISNIYIFQLCYTFFWIFFFKMIHPSCLLIRHWDCFDFYHFDCTIWTPILFFFSSVPFLWNIIFFP